MRNISQTVRDREFVSTENNHKVAYRLSNKVEIFDLRSFERSRSLIEISNVSQTERERELVSTEDHYKVAFELSKKMKYLTFGDPERSKLLTEISNAEYLVNVTR